MRPFFLNLTILLFVFVSIYLLFKDLLSFLKDIGLSKLNMTLRTVYAIKAFLLRKEVIHPHVPVGIPCYDLAPIISPTLGVWLLTVRITTSSKTSSHGLTGGVYKARERIHRDFADSRLLAIPTS